MIRIRCFGGVSVEDSDGRSIHFRSRKHVALLIFLAANRDRVHGRDDLVRLLWDSPMSSARHSLSQALYDLKRRLGEFSTERFGDGLRLDSGIEFEGREFEEAVKRDDLRRAVGLYRGDFASAYDRVGTDAFESWIDDERRRYRILAQAALHRYVERCDGRGDWGQMCVAAVKLVGINPMSEKAHQGLMRALWLHGDQASALRHFGEIEDQLSRDLPGGISRQTQELVERIRSSAPPPPAGISRAEPPIVGREREFARLRELLEAARRGKGVLAVVRGEAGIGKTRLSAELARCAALEGMRVLKSRCYAAEENVAYGPVLDAVQEFADLIYSDNGAGGPLYPLISQLLRSEPSPDAKLDLEADLAGERRRLCEEFVVLISALCADAAMLWIVDDVQWIDGSSASLLSYLIRRLSDGRLLLLVTVRDEAELSEACRKLLRDRSTDQEATTLSLCGLSLEAIRSLIEHVETADATTDLPDRIHRLSGGNPFLALELLRDAGPLATPEAEDLAGEALHSDRVRSLLQTRLQGLAPRSIRLLEAIAVLGRHASPAHAADAAGLTLPEASDVSEELYARGILRDADEQLEFAHDITREFVYRNLGGVRRASLHLFVAEALASDLQATLPTIARHFHLGGDRARAFEYGIRAARASIASFGHAEAKSMASLALSQAVTNAERFEALGIIGRSAFALGQLDVAEERLNQILELDQGVSAIERVQAHLMQGRIRLENSDWEGATRVLQAADIASLESPSERMEAKLGSLSLQLKGAIRQLDGRLARQISGEIRKTHAVGLDRRILTNLASARSYYSLAAYAAFFESVTEADALIDLAWRYCSDGPDELSIRVLFMRGVVKSHSTRWDEAVVLFQQALAIARRNNQVLEMGRALNNLAYCALEQANWAEAERCCRASMDTYSRLPPGTYVTATPLTNLGDALFFQGFARKAIPLYEEALRETRPDLRPQMLASLGLAAIQLGETGAAAKHWASLCDLEDAELGGVQERFKIDWMRAYMTALSAPNEARQLLIEAANAQRDLNLGSHLKLLWLARLLPTESPPQDTQAENTIVTRLKAARLGWFVRFSSRWWSAAQSKMPARLS